MKTVDRGLKSFEREREREKVMVKVKERKTINGRDSNELIGKRKIIKKKRKKKRKKRE